MQEITRDQLITLDNPLPCESFEYFRMKMTEAIYFAIDQDEHVLSRFPSKPSGFQTQGFLRRREQFSLD